MARNDYWKNREEAHRQKRITDEKAYNAKIRKIYDNMIDIATKEVNGFYSKYASKEGITLAEAKRRISTADIAEYAKKAEKYVPAKDMSDKANEEMRLYNAMMSINRLEMLKSSIGLGMVEGFNELDQTMQEQLTKAAESEFVRQAGILGGTVGDPRSAAKTIVNSSFHNATFSQRIWMHQDMLRSELDKTLQEGLIKGESSLKLARHISKVFGASRKDAERLMRTEMSRVYTEAQKESYDAAGYEDYTYIALGDACEICSPLDGKHFKVKQMRVGDNAPPMHPNCRCSTVPWVDREKLNHVLTNSKDKGIITPAGSDAIRNTKADVLFDPENDYSLHLTGYSDAVNEGLSLAAYKVAELGGKDDYEHLVLVDLVTGKERLYECINEKHNCGGEKFWSFLKNNPDAQVAFVHNHTTDSSFSETDMRTLLREKQVPIMIAVRDDSVKYVAERKEMAPLGDFDLLYEKELEQLRQDLRTGVFETYEYPDRREMMIVDNLLRDYTIAGRIVEYDGRKH